ncbi:MAG TPA: class I adenylate-forming enzyme family protein [Solirubrobacterales bacterium]|jgi:acyl-CoA synthetase (AMP-forming)/AMP-acid ligase II
MITLLERAAEAAPRQAAVVTSEGSVSYGELLDQARRAGAALRERQITRFAVIEPDAAWVIRLLAGAALVGAEPCQYQPDVAAKEFERQTATFGHSIVVTRRSDLGGAHEIIRPEELTEEVPAAVDSPSEAQPLMIRTTGTTGPPKAARHDWRILGRTVGNRRPRPDQRWLLAYGPHQFAGIQVLQHVVASQATLIAPFPRQPRDGLEALLSERVTCVSATPTYFRFLLSEARSADAELPPLEQITLGGEAIPPDLLDRLGQAFPGARISQVYASTEFGSVMSVRDGEAGFPADALYSDSNPSATVRVIDGALWVRAEAGMLGYAGEQGSDVSLTEVEGWRPTGDLVEIVGSRVRFRGRDSEVINVGGVKVDPLPVENRIAGLPGVAAARVFGRSNPMTGAIVAAEVIPTGEADQKRIRLEIKEALEDLPPAWHPRSVKFVESVETRGDKTVRGMQS